MCLQRVTFLDQLIQSDSVLLKRRRTARRHGHLSVQFTDFALERKRAMRFVLPPAHQMSTNHFAAAANENQLRIAFRQFPCEVEVIDNVSVVYVFAEMGHPVVKSDYAAQRYGFFYCGWRLERSMAIAHQTVQAPFADVLDDGKGALSLRA